MTDRFSPKPPGVEDWFTFNFRRDLPAGTWLIESPAPVVTVTVEEGVDPSPHLMKSGTPVISNGERVFHLLKDGVPNTQYKAHCLAKTNDGRTLERCGTFWVQVC